MKISNNWWDADGKTIYNLKRAVYYDEAVTKGQTTKSQISQTKGWHPQTMKSRLLIPDYESSDHCDLDADEKWSSIENIKRWAMGCKRQNGSISVSGQLPTYPSPNSTTVYW